MPLVVTLLRLFFKFFKVLISKMFRASLRPVELVRDNRAKEVLHNIQGFGII